MAADLANDGCGRCPRHSFDVSVPAFKRSSGSVPQGCIQWARGKVKKASTSFTSSICAPRLGELASQLIGHAAPVRADRVGSVSNEDARDGRADQKRLCRDQRPAPLPGTSTPQQWPLHQVTVRVLATPCVRWKSRARYKLIMGPRRSVTGCSRSDSTNSGTSSRKSRRN